MQNERAKFQGGRQTDSQRATRPRRSPDDMASAGSAADEEPLGLEKMTREQLLEEVTELELDLRERDDEIQRLTRELQALRTGGRKGLVLAADEDELVRENEELRDALAREQGEGARLQDQLAEVTAQLKVVVSEKIEAEDELRLSRQRQTELERELVGARDSSRTALLRSQDVSKQKQEEQRQQLQLLQENENMQNEVPILGDVAALTSLELVAPVAARGGGQGAGGAGGGDGQTRRRAGGSRGPA